MNTTQLIQFKLNGTNIEVEVQSNVNVIELLNQFQLKGARESCGQGLCGACTVLVDNLAVSGCLMPAVMLDGKSVETVEGLSGLNEPLHPIQQAFIDQGAFQCGFCTPGFVIMTKHLLDLNPNPTEKEIRDFFAGNLCRCGTYPEIIAAVNQASQSLLKTNSN
jgi:aerobic-type carbon monoxide dehydrogenase small subunit (CoxS/CutS family)